MTMASELELAAEIERLDAGASKGPWRVANMDWNGTHGMEWLSSETRQSIADCSENVAITEHGFCGRVELAEIKANAALIALLRNNAATIVAGLRAASRVERVARLVAQQAEDEGLWFEAQTAPEAYLQQELRKLHAAVEDKP